jgi:hypothetical protein
MAIVAVLATACSSPGSPVSRTAKMTALQEDVAYASCVRSHGVPNFPDPVRGNFPDPQSDGWGFDINTNTIGVSQSVLQKAENACSYLQPSGGTQTAAQFAGFLTKQLKFAACMRSHGVPGFPDPTSSGQSISYNIPGSVRESPEFATAARDCQKLGGLMAERFLSTLPAGAKPWLQSP